MKFKKHICAAWLSGMAAFGTVSTPTYAFDPFIGQMMLFAGNFCPRGFAAANGQLMSIASNNALFSIVGTFYGGDGRTTFGLPDLRGRAAVSVGQGPGLSNYSNGQKIGVESTQLTVANMPAHTHSINTTKDIATNGGPGGKYFAAMGTNGTSGPFVYAPALGAADKHKTMAADSVSTVGSGLPVTNLPPTIAMQWCIALEGIYPSR